jgi:twinkle protein
VNVIPDSIDLSEYLKEPDPGEKVIAACTMAQRVIDSMCMPAEHTGCVLPWSKTKHDIRLRPGEVSLWPGINGHGKSAMTSEVALSLCWQGQRVCIASLEMKPVKTLSRMVRQAAASHEPQIPFIRGFHNWTENRLWIYDQLGMVDPKKMQAVIRWCHDQLGIQHFFLDSLMKCVRGDDDYNGQKDFVNSLCTIALDTGMHIHLIHHAKKMADERTMPGKFDAKGSSSITDQVDNVFTVWRNKRKEADRQKGGSGDWSEPDAYLLCDKQRHGEWEGPVKLWYDQQSFRFTQDATNPPEPYDIALRQPGEDS